MNKIEASTKERILTVALDMFSIRGYNSVSIRDISKAIGIKESSIYYHFTNKKDIFGELLIKAEQLILAMKSNFNKALSSTTQIELNSFVEVGIAYVEKFLLEDNIFKIINMLTIEKQTNHASAFYYNKILFEIPLEHNEQVYSLIIEKGIIKNENPLMLASEYQSIILFIFFKYFSSYTTKNESKSLARDELASLLRRFYNRYFVKEE